VELTNVHFAESRDVGEEDLFDDRTKDPLSRSERLIPAAGRESEQFSEQFSSN
jgi:hypothetical protein